MTDKPLYRAWYRHSGRITPMPEDVLYKRRSKGNLIGELPWGTNPMPNGECGTLDRTDGGDPFEYAVFKTPSGRIVVVERET